MALGRGRQQREGRVATVGVNSPCTEKAEHQLSPQRGCSQCMGGRLEGVGIKYIKDRKETSRALTSRLGLLGLI